MKGTTALSTEICKLPSAGSNSSLVIAGFLLVVFGIGVRRFIRISLHQLSVVAVVPILLMAMIGTTAGRMFDPCRGRQ
jgi:hypothetical protein